MIRRALVVLWLMAAVPPAALAGILLFEAATWRGHFFALTALGLLALPVVWASRAALRRKAVVTAAEAALIAVLGLTAPQVPDFAGQTGLSQRSAGARMSLFAWLPELDQMVLGTWPLTLLDPALDVAHAKRLRGLLPPVYGDLRLIGSNLGNTADPRSGQTFVFVPPHSASERLPLLIFVHGSGGSFVAYQALLQRWAVAGHFAVVSPSFGFGNWGNPGGVETVEEARAFAEASLPVDATRVAVAGLSNGGRAITRLVARDRARRWPLIIALSAVIEVDELTDAWAGREVLLLHGEADERIPFDYFQEFASALEKRGAHVARHSWPQEDHFLWFSKPEQLEAVALPWLAAAWKASP